MRETIGIILMAYGTPENKEDIEPYLKDIFRGKPVPYTVLEETIEKYERIGFSPLKRITAEQCELLQQRLQNLGINAVVKEGMKHWKPSIKDAFENLRKYKPDVIIGMIAHPFSSVLGSAEYVDIFNKNAGKNKTLMVSSWYENKQLYEAWAEKVSEKIDRLKDKKFYTIFTSHGLPLKVEDTEYKKELAEFSAKLAEKMKIEEYGLAYQNGEHKDWYTPEVMKRLEELKNKGYDHALIIPIGYLSESLETLYDIDVMYKQKADEIGLTLERVECLNTSEKLIDAMAETINKKLA